MFLRAEEYAVLPPIWRPGLGHIRIRCFTRTRYACRTSSTGQPSPTVAANGRIRDLAAELGEEYDWDFLCECDDPFCTERLTLAPSSYDDLRARHVPVLAAGHPVAAAALVRSISAQLREEATALRNQAEQQTRRAHRNRAAAARRIDLVCQTCGYDIWVDDPPPRCPVCRADDWHEI